MFDPADFFALSAGELAHAKTLRERGLDDDAIASEIRWKRDLTEKVLMARPGRSQRDPDSIEKLKAELQAIRQENAELDRRLATALAERDQALQDKENDRFVGKSRQTALKAVFLVGETFGYVAGKPNSAVKKMMDKLHENDVAADDDEAFRDLLKEAYARKSGGYWKRKTS